MHSSLSLQTRTHANACGPSRPSLHVSTFQRLSGSTPADTGHAHSKNSRGLSRARTLRVRTPRALTVQSPERERQTERTADTHTWSRQSEEDHTCVHSCLVCKCAHMHTRTHACTYVRAHTHTHTHTPQACLEARSRDGQRVSLRLRLLHVSFVSAGE